MSGTRKLVWYGVVQVSLSLFYLGIRRVLSLPVQGLSEILALLYGVAVMSLLLYFFFLEGITYLAQQSKL